MLCRLCNYNMTQKKYTKVKDGIAWKCINTLCEQYRKMISIRRGSFFEGFNLSFLDILQILLKWSDNSVQESVVNDLEIHLMTYKKVSTKFLNLAKASDVGESKLGGPGMIVQADETALNHKIKAHRGRALLNKTDALCIIEFDSCITRAFACVIENKKEDTTIPIIIDKVVEGSIIWTDESKLYSRLGSVGYLHDTVCHKYEFVNSETGVNTQAVESFNNELNLEIKRKKGIATNKRPEFLEEFVWKFNNGSRRFLRIWELLKIKH
jgi:transposase-like protein